LAASTPSSSTSDKPLYIASCVFNQNYTQTTKPLTACLDDHIDFNRTNTTLVVDVQSIVVDRYEQEEKKRADNERQQSGSTTASNASGVQTRSQHKQSTTSLLDCFKYFTTKETLSDNDQWYCPKCKLLKNASKKIDLWLLPKVLIVQLKRFNYTRHYRDKIDLLIDCPIYDLDLSQFVLNPSEKANAKYDLIAVSNHMGGLGGGHYTAHAKNMHDHKWHTFDDSCVSDIDESNVISKSAYVLIYQQQTPAAQTSIKESPRKTSARTNKVPS
jgi:ubiquitin C-terminal hydrolase